jgi:hypothetical protein
MPKTLISAAIATALIMAGSGAARAQVDLSSYADAEGFLDIQALTCAQLAGTWQDQADLLSAWYSGWYNGLAKRHYMDIRKGREAEHELIMYCKANPQLRIIQAIDVVFKGMRERAGIKVQ